MRSFLAGGPAEWPGCLAALRQAGWLKGCHRQGVLPQNGGQDGQGCAASSLLLRRRSGRRCDGSQGHPRSRCAVECARCGSRGSARSARAGRAGRAPAGRPGAEPVAAGWSGLFRAVVVGRPAHHRLSRRDRHREPPSKHAGSSSAPPQLTPARASRSPWPRRTRCSSVQVYLNFSPADVGAAGQAACRLPAARGRLPARLERRGLAAAAVRAGRRHYRADSQHAVVTLLARASGQLMELGVPVYAADGGLSDLGGAVRCFRRPPGRATPEPPSQSSDPAAAAALSRQLPAFFRPTPAVTRSRSAGSSRRARPSPGLGGSVTYGSIAGIYVPPGGTTPHITVSVMWHFPARQRSVRVVGRDDRAGRARDDVPDDCRPAERQLVRGGDRDVPPATGASHDENLPDSMRPPAPRNPQ